MNPDGITRNGEDDDMKIRASSLFLRDLEVLMRIYVLPDFSGFYPICSENVLPMFYREGKMFYQIGGEQQKT
jgi:hypothetical protein